MLSGGRSIASIVSTAALTFVQEITEATDEDGLSRIWIFSR
jgi:hypothetical protein